MTPLKVTRRSGKISQFGGEKIWGDFEWEMVIIDLDAGSIVFHAMTGDRKDSNLAGISADHDFSGVCEYHYSR